MTSEDIKIAVENRIKDAISGANVASDETARGFKKPAYIVEIVPGTKNDINTGLYDRNLTVIVHGFPLSNTSSELLRMQDQLEKAFDLSINVGERVLTIEETEGEITDKVLHFSFDLTWTDSREEKDLPYMENLNLKEVYSDGTT